MRILIASPYYFPYTSGMTVYAQRLAEGLAKRGHEVRILTYNHAELLEKEKINGVGIFRVPALVKFGRGIFSHEMLREFLQILKWADVVNIHAPFFECGLLARLAHSKRKRIFLTYHCDLVLTGWVAPFLIDRLHRLSVQRAAKYSEKIFVNSTEYAMHSYIRKFLHKAIEVPPPIDDSRFKKVRSEKFRKKHGLGKKDFNAGFLGRITYEKGLENLIGAAKLLKAKIPNLKILVAGEGVQVAGGKSESIIPKLKEKIKNLSLSNIIFTGKIPDAELNEFFSSLDVFVLPSINRLESFGMVQVEAMLCGTPVVASRIPGVSDAVKKTGFGLLAEPKNSHSLAEKIFEVYKNRKRYTPDRKIIMKFFGIKKTLDAYEKVFRQSTLPS